MNDRQTDQDLPDFLRWMDAALDGIAVICKLLTGVSLVVLTVIFGWLVFGRYVLNATPTWVEQVALLLVMMIAFLGAAVGIHENTHLSVAVIRNAVTSRLRFLFVIASDLLLAGFGMLMLWYGGQLTLFKWGSMIPLIRPQVAAFDCWRGTDPAVLARSSRPASTGTRHAKRRFAVRNP